MNRILYFWILLFSSNFSFAQTPDLPWLNFVDSNSIRYDISHISTAADVVVSDGMEYQTKSFYQDPQRVVFQLIYPDQNLTLGIEGKYAWQHDGEKETGGTDFVFDFVLGHQFHAQILYFDKIHPSILKSEDEEFSGQICTVYTTDDTGFTWKIYVDKQSIPLGFKMLIPNENPIIIQLYKWKFHKGFQLPFEISIDDGVRSFNYQYNEIEFNAGSLESFRLDESLLTDEQKLLRLHRMGMDDHIEEGISRLKEIRGDSIQIVSSGQIYSMNSSEFDEGMSRIMNSRDHSSYDDLIRPIVKISKDGSLGWVIVQVEAKGSMLDEGGKPSKSLNFISAWIELYEKIDGKWIMIGNVSNFQD